MRQKPNFFCESLLRAVIDNPAMQHGNVSRYNFNARTSLGLSAHYLDPTRSRKGRDAAGLIRIGERQINDLFLRIASLHRSRAK